MKRSFNRHTAMGLFKRMTGTRTMTVMSSDADSSSRELSTQDRAAQTTDAALAAESFTVREDATPYADNDDIHKRRFFKRGITRIRRYMRYAARMLKTFWAFVMLFASPKFSSDEKRIMLFRLRRFETDELEQHRRAREEHAIFLFHKQQARMVQDQLIGKLTDLRFCYFITKNERVYIKKKIQVGHVDVSPYAYTYVINRVPFGVKMTDIAQEPVTNELCATVGKKVRIELDMFGLRITVEVGSTLSIPNFVGFGDLDDKNPMPKNLPPLAFWAGLSANGAPVYRNLADAPHLIVAGQTGGGKSNIENTIVCTLLRNNTPDKLRLVFFDLKGGVEFSQYEGIPHLWPMKDGDWSTTGIVEYPSDVMPALNILFKECMSRLSKLKKSGVRNISEYNRKKRDNRMPYIVVIFDEWASTVKLVGKECELVLSNIANLSRAAGIHFILSTQYPKAEILNTTISVNFPWRIAFNMTPGASQSVLGDWGAVGLSPVGRAVMLTMDGQMQIQTPRITNQNVVDVVNEARTGVKMIGNMQNVDVSDILEWAINKSSGRLDQDSVFNQFKEKITSAALRSMLREMENKIFEVQGTLYKVLPNTPGSNLGRRMVLAEETPLSAEIPSRDPRPAPEPPEITPEMAEVEI